MSEPASELQRPVRGTRRPSFLVVIMAAVGLLAGVATAAIVPVMVTSSALVFLPQAAQNAAAAAAPATGQPDGFTATQEIIAGSNVVLATALPQVHPATSLAGLRHDIRIGSPASDIISISATGQTAGDAGAAANAVADSYVRYVGAGGSPALRLPAAVLRPASSATGTAWFLRLLAGALLGAVSGLFAGGVAVVSRRLIPWPAG